MPVSAVWIAVLALAALAASPAPAKDTGLIFVSNEKTSRAAPRG